MAGKIAVLAGGRQAEALRMAIGLTLLDDTVDVFLTAPLQAGDEVAAQLEGARELAVGLYSNMAEQGFEPIGVREMAEKILEYDHILPY